jgi:hypothetical protein
MEDEVKQESPETVDPEKPEPVDILTDESFDTSLFAKAPARVLAETDEERPADEEPVTVCPYYPKACEKASCSPDCERNPESYMDPKVKEVFDIEPWSNYCFTCGEFVPSRNHEDALESGPEVVYSHTCATGFAEYKSKLSEWTMKRLTGNDGPKQPLWTP